MQRCCTAITLQLALCYLVQSTDCVMQSWTCLGFFPALTERLKVAVLCWLYCAYMCLHTLQSQTPAVEHGRPVVRKTTVFMNICIRPTESLAQHCRHRHPPNATNSSRSLPDQLQHFCCGLLEQCIFIEALCNYCYFIRVSSVFFRLVGAAELKADGVYFFYSQVHKKRKQIITPRQLNAHQNRVKHRTARRQVAWKRALKGMLCLRNKYLAMAVQRWEVTTYCY